MTYISWRADAGADAKSYLTSNLFKSLSGQRRASQHQQVKFIRAYLDLGNVPIKQNKAVEQQSAGPPGVGPKAGVYVIVAALAADLFQGVQQRSALYYVAEMFGIKGRSTGDFLKD